MILAPINSAYAEVIKKDPIIYNTPDFGVKGDGYEEYRFFACIARVRESSNTSSPKNIWQVLPKYLSRKGLELSKIKVDFSEKGKRHIKVLSQRMKDIKF